MSVLTEISIVVVIVALIYITWVAWKLRRHESHCHCEGLAPLSAEARKADYDEIKRQKNDSEG